MVVVELEEVGKKEEEEEEVVWIAAAPSQSRATWSLGLSLPEKPQQQQSLLLEQWRSSSA